MSAAPDVAVPARPRVVLIHPPVNDPRSPRLALPSLAAFLRAAGVSTRQIDLDLESLLAVLSPARILSAGARVRAAGTDASWVASAGTLAEQAEAMAGRIGEALDVLRDPVRFFDPGDLSAARDLIFGAVELLGAAADPPVRYRLDLLQYDVRGFDPARLADLFAVASLPGANVFREHWEEVLFPSLDRDRPELVGISIPTRMQIFPSLTLARELRRRGHFVVLGGSLMTKFTDRLARLPEFFAHFADAVVVHEGETALAALLEELGGGRVFDRVPNLVYEEGGAVRRTRLHQERLRELPSPDFDGLPLERYLTPHVVLPVQFGKGCYWNRCAFCSSSKVNRALPRHYLTRAPEQVVDDMARYRDRHGCTHFVFTDEALSPPALDGIATTLLARREAGMRFAAYARFEESFSAAHLARAARAGLRHLFFGLEVAEQAALDRMDKGIRLRDVEPVLRACRDAGIRHFVFTMYGLPAQDIKSIRDTAEFFVRNRDLFDPRFGGFIFRPFELQEGTPYVDAAESHGVVLPPEARSCELPVSFGRRWSCTRGPGAEELDLLASSLFAGFAEAFPEWDEFPPLLQPVLEEWSLLYASHHGSRPLPTRLGLPGDAGHPCRLRWNPFATVTEREGHVNVANRRASVDTSREFYDNVAASGYQAPPEILARIAGKAVEAGSASEAAARQSLKAALRANLLQLHCRHGEDG